MRYIGGKTLLLPYILETIRAEAADTKSVMDIFSGSGAVGKALKESGYRVWSNDFLYFCYVLARGTVGLCREPGFSAFPFDVIDYLNALTLEQSGYAEEDCFVYRNYSPGGDCQRMYFRKENAIQIDLIRMKIEDWRKAGLLSEDEYFYLLAALISAVPCVANIAGVFGAYLKFWDRRAYRRLCLKRPGLRASDERAVCTNRDFSEVLAEPCDLLYADPPYNEREYLPNYHVLETIARYDRPKLYGVTGLRNYENQRSAFCRRASVQEAFETLIGKCRSKYVLISYHNEGLMGTEELTELCRKYAAPGSFRLIEMDYRRYQSKRSGRRAGLKEQLYFLRKR